MAFGLSAGAASLLGAVAGPVVGGLLGGSSSGGGQQAQTVSKEPWAEAAPWLKQNIQTGQGLQNYYQQNPFNQQQQNAYRNLASGTDYVNRMTPGMLQQMSQPVGFSRSNPQARPQAYNFAAPMGMPPAQNLGYGAPMAPSGSGARGIDGAAYLRANPDVAASPEFAQNPALHYMRYGAQEGRGATMIGQDMNQSANPFGNGGLPTVTAPQLTPADIQRLIQTSLAAQTYNAGPINSGPEGSA